MKVITSIYLNCRPDLRDEWLAGADVDAELEAAIPQEHALRTLIQFYNKTHYARYLVPLSSPEPTHQRSDSTSAVMLEDALIIPHRRQSSMIDADVFPPNRSARDTEAMTYNPDGMIDYWMHEYEYVMSQVFGDGDPEEGPPWGVTRGTPGPAEPNDEAWNRLGEIMRAKGAPDDDGISDSESVVSIGELGEEARFGNDDDGLTIHQRRKSGEGENTWEHMSPTTMSLLPRSPSNRRRSSSSGSPLRPVFPGGILDSDVFDEEDLRGPIPKASGTDDEEVRNFGAVDEVEYAYGE